MCDPEPLAEKVLQLGFDRLHPVHVALSNHDMRLDRSIALIQLQDMNVMNLFDVVDTLHGLDQRDEINIRRIRSPQYANRPANHAEDLVSNIGRYRSDGRRVGKECDSTLLSRWLTDPCTK